MSSGPGPFELQLAFQVSSALIFLSKCLIFASILPLPPSPPPRVFKHDLPVLLILQLYFRSFR